MVGEIRILDLLRQQIYASGERSAPVCTDTGVHRNYSFLTMYAVSNFVTSAHVLVIGLQKRPQQHLAPPVAPQRL